MTETVNYKYPRFWIKLCTCSIRAWCFFLFLYVLSYLSVREALTLHVYTYKSIKPKNIKKIIQVPHNSMSEVRPFDPTIPQDEVDRLFRKLEDTQKSISEWRHFTTDIEGLRVHFIHEKARVWSTEAIPLLLIHGWPGTFYKLSLEYLFTQSPTGC